MPTQLHLPVQPAGAREINAVVAMVERDEQVAYFASGVPLFIHRADDPVGRRVAAGQMIALGLARQDELSAVLHVNRTTLYRQQRRLQAHGVLGVVDGQRGPRGPHRFTAEKRQRVAALLEAGRSIRRAAEQVGVTEGTIRHALRRGELRGAPPPAAPCTGTADAERAGCAGRWRRGRPAPHRARPGPAGPVDGSGTALRRGRGGALWRGHAGPAGRAHARAAGRGAAGLRGLEARLLWAAGHAAVLDLHGAAADSDPRATAGAAPRGIGRSCSASTGRPRSRPCGASSGSWRPAGRPRRSVSGWPSAGSATRRTLSGSSTSTAMCGPITGPPIRCRRHT